MSANYVDYPFIASDIAVYRVAIHKLIANVLADYLSAISLLFLRGTIF